MIFRLFYAIIYSALIVILIGFPQAALAVVSCQDTINPNTSIRYSDALVSFKAYNGKTYAIAKSAATGGLSTAETFFDLAANITRAYLMTGDSTGSLKNFLSLGQYGAATPVRIDSAETQQFILTQFGKYLGTASTPQSTYIDAWKEFGSGGFAAINGTALSFTNWASPVYTSQDPQAVVMGGDGKWTSGLDGARTAQIVQIDGVLDCSTDFSPSQTGTGTTTTPPPTGSSEPDLSQPVCGQDLNGNGYAGDPGETANCSQTTQGLFCPVGSVNCVENYSAPVCPAGSTLNTARDMCQADATVTCGSGYAYDASIDKCVEPVTCSDGGTFNRVTDQCEKLVLNQCPSGYTYDSTPDTCRKSVDCSGGTLNPTKDRCETPPTWNCPTGFTYKTASLKCEASPYCPAGTVYNASRDRCEAAVGSCPAGYSYNTVLDTCVATPACASGGVLNDTADKCELTSSITCLSGWSYNRGTGKCEQTPNCGSPGSYNATYDLCLTASTGTSCPSGYSYSASYGSCISSPSCLGGSYNQAANQCQASPVYSCSDPGYTYNGGNGRCEKSPVCSAGTYNAAYNKCLQTMTPGCYNGYTYSATKGRCEYQPPTCPGGTTYNAITNKCEWMTSYAASANYSCPSGGTLSGSTCITTSSSPGTATCSSYNGIYSCGIGNFAGVELHGSSCYAACWVQFGCFPYLYAYASTPWRSACYKPNSPLGPALYTCPAGSTGTGTCTNGYCTGSTCNTSSSYAATITYSCPSGGSLSGSTCYVTNQANPTCTGGNFDGASDVCWQSYTPTCPGGMTYDGTIGQCVVTATCANGLLDGSRDVCYQTATLGCSSGYTLSGSFCTATPSCVMGGTLNGAIGYCTFGAAYTCPAGYSYSATYGQCFQAANCGAGSPNGSLDVCQQSYSLTCPSDYTLNGTTCQAAPPCATGGSYNAALDLCDGGSNVCSSPLALDPGVDKCFQAASCSGGTLNAASDKCEAAATVNCSAFAWDGASQVCYSPPVCNLGAYDATVNECRATVTRNCSTYGWSATQGKCTWQIVCPKDGSYSLSSTVAYSPTLDQCVSDARHDCPSGTAYNGLPIEKCEAVPICSGDGIYNTTVHSCFLGMNTCPLGTQYTCMSNQGTMQCSPNQCFTAGTSGTEQITTMDESLMQDDGQRDQNGNCLDQLYVFNGKSSRCRPPGLTVGMINDCCQSDSIGSDDMGGNISMVANGIQTAYEVGQVAYYSYLVGSGAATVTPLVGTASVGIVTATGTTTVSGAVASGVSAAAASGTTGAAAVGSAMEAYVGALLNPATIAVAVVVLVVMKILMGNGCDQGDIQTGMQAAAKDCHYLGDYCEKKWPMVGCVQKAKGYCCFNTKMARIIHEQGRPQLQAFGTDGGWGTPSSPNCRGFTPDEFQSLDFSRIDLAEYFGDIQKDLDTKIQGAQATIQNKVKQQYGATVGAKQ